MKTQQQVIEILLKMRPGTGCQRFEIFRLIVERLKNRQLQAQSALTDDPARLFDDGRGGAVGKLRIQRSQRHLVDALSGQAGQCGFDGRLTITHRQFDRPLRPVRFYSLLQTATEHDQRRAFRPPDRGIGMRRLFGTLDQNQRDEQAPQRPW